MITTTNSSPLLREFLDKGRLESIRVVDAHTHMGGVYGVSMPVSELGGIIPIMDEQNIEMIWCCTHPDMFDPLTLGMESFALSQRYPGRVKAFMGTNPNYFDEFRDAIKRNVEAVRRNPGFIGFKCLPEYHRYAFDAAAYEYFLDVADEQSLIVLVHTWGGSPYNSPRAAENILKKHKGLRLILGHSSPGELDNAIRVANTYENAYLDLCDIHRNNDVVEKMVRAAGSSKVLYGTDMPWYDFSYCLGSVLFADIAEEDRHNILYRNQHRLLAGIAY